MKNYSWHPMHEDDLPKIKEIMHQAYPDFPEDIRCTRERLRLFPAGCSVLRRDDEGAVLGYVISHPWENLSIPRLSSFLGALPISAEVYYIHDIAMLPDVQGIGAARAMLVQLNQIARSLHIKSLRLWPLQLPETTGRHEVFAQSMSLTHR